MKLNVSRKSFSEALSIASRFTSSRSQLPILNNILLETSGNKLSVSSTNLEMSVYLSIASKIEEEGKISIPSRVISEVVSALSSDTVEISTEKDVLNLKGGGFSSKILGMNASDFPQVPSTVSKNAIEMDSGLLIDSLAKVMYAISSDETRPVLTGGLFIFGSKSLSLVSTDGFRLSKTDIDLQSSDNENKIILPKGVLAELSRIVKNEKILLEFRKDDKQAVFQVGDLILSSRVIEGEFPDFQKIIPANHSLNVAVGKDDLMQGVKLASVFARDMSNVIRFVFGDDSFKIVSESSQSGSQENIVDAKINFNNRDILGDKSEFVIAFNCKFVEDFLASVDGENLEIRFNDANAPGVFLDTEDDKLLHLIMPVRI